MNLWHSILVSCFLLICAAGLMLSHRRSWRRFRCRSAQQDELDAGEFDYRRRQFRRRMQTSAMLGVLAVTLPVADWLTARSGSSLLHLVCWSVVLLLAAWLGLLALADVVATKYHFGRMRQSYLIEETKLKAELHRMEAARGDGKAEEQDSVAKDGRCGNN